MTSIGRLERVLRQDSKQPSRMQLLHTVSLGADDEPDAGAGGVVLHLTPSAGVDAAERRVPNGVRRPGTLPQKAVHTQSLMDD